MQETRPPFLGRRTDINQMAFMIPETDRRPIIFLDVDGVLVLNRGATFDKNRVHELEPEVCRRLIHQPAAHTLTELLEAREARLVLTSNWVRFTSKVAFQRLMHLAGWEQIASSLHRAWSAPRVRTADSRLQVVEDWLKENHRCESYCVIDDDDSGFSLSGSVHDNAGRVVLCQPNIGLHRGHLPLLHSALTS